MVCRLLITKEQTKPHACAKYKVLHFGFIEQSFFVLYNTVKSSLAGHLRDQQFCPFKGVIHPRENER